MKTQRSPVKEKEKKSSRMDRILVMFENWEFDGWNKRIKRQSADCEKKVKKISEKAEKIKDENERIKKKN